MRVSFDLDDVLFVSPDRFETEPPPHAPFDLIFKERLRKGTIDLIHTLQKEGFEVWVYTSSYRSERYLRALFSRYRIHFDRWFLESELHKSGCVAETVQLLVLQVVAHQRPLLVLGQPVALAVANLL